MDAGFVSHLVAAAAFLVLTLLLLVSWKGKKQGAFLLSASGATTLWAAVAAYSSWAGGRIDPVVGVLEVLRSAGWIALLWSALVLGMQRSGTALFTRLGPVAVAALCVAVVGFDLYPSLVGTLSLPCDEFTCPTYARLGLAVIGLVLVENLFRNTEPERRWYVKNLCFGVGGIFVYDVFLFANAVLVHQLDNDLLQARGITNALVVPLIALAAARDPEWSFKVSVSRRAVFYSATLIGTGFYMLLMAAAGYYLRKFGGGWGPLLQLAFLFGAGILLVSILASGRFRSELKVFLSKHFFSYKYDYRDEWLNFIGTISATGRDFSLRDRTIQAVANIVDSPDGALWLEEEPGRLTLAATSSEAWPAEEEPADGPLARFLAEREWVIDLDEHARNSGAYAHCTLPEWMRKLRHAWLIVPLVREQRLIGFIMLGHSRAPRTLNWEDYDLLKTVGHQAASYLALEQAARALAEARQFEAFNRRFAFVLHDIKNLVSQLSLMVKNAAMHRSNPAFQDDMIQTVRESVEKMNRLLVRLHADSVRGAQSVVELAPLLRKSVADKAGAPGSIAFDCQVADLVVAVDEDRLAAVVDNLIQNAIEASPADAVVRVRLLGRDGDAVIEIEDSGPGMDADFIRNHLFRPFESTKRAGYGVGVFESREFVREMGGRLDVLSEPGKGTTMRVSLPTVGGPPKTAENRHKAMA